MPEEESKELFSFADSYFGSSSKFVFKWNHLSSVLAVAGNNGFAFLFDRKGSLMRKIALETTSQCIMIDWDNNNENVAFAFAKQENIVVFDTVPNSLVTVSTTLSDISCMKWSPSSPVLAVGGSKGNMMFFRKDTMRKSIVQTKHTGTIISGDWSLDNYLLLGSSDKSVSIVSMDGSTVWSCELRNAAVSAYFSRSTKSYETDLMLVNTGKAIVIGSVQSGVNEVSFPSKYGKVALITPPSRDTFLVGFSDGFLSVCDTGYDTVPGGTESTGGNEIVTVRVSKDSIDALSISPCSGVVSVTSGGTVRMYKAATLDELHEDDILPSFIPRSGNKSSTLGNVLNAVWSPDGAILTVVSPRFLLGVAGNSPPLVSVSRENLIFTRNTRGIVVVPNLFLHLQARSSGHPVDSALEPIALTLPFEPSIISLGGKYLSVVGTHQSNSIFVFDLTRGDLSQSIVSQRAFAGTIVAIRMGRNSGLALLDNGSVFLYFVEGAQAPISLSFESAEDSSGPLRAVHISVGGNYGFVTLSNGAVLVVNLRSGLISKRLSLYPLKSNVRDIALEDDISPIVSCIPNHSGTRCVVFLADGTAAVFFPSGIFSNGIAPVSNTTPISLLTQNAGLSGYDIREIDDRLVVVQDISASDNDAIWNAEDPNLLCTFYNESNVNFGVPAELQAPHGGYQSTKKNSGMKSLTERSITTFVVTTHSLSGPNVVPIGHVEVKESGELVSTPASLMVSISSLPLLLNEGRLSLFDPSSYFVSKTSESPLLSVLCLRSLSSHQWIHSLETEQTTSPARLMSAFGQLLSLQNLRKAWDAARALKLQAAWAAIAAKALDLLDFDTAKRAYKELSEVGILYFLDLLLPGHYAVLQSRVNVLYGDEAAAVQSLVRSGLFHEAFQLALDLDDRETASQVLNTQLGSGSGGGFEHRRVMLAIDQAVALIARAAGAVVARGDASIKSAGLEDALLVLKRSRAELLRCISAFAKSTGLTDVDVSAADRELFEYKASGSALISPTKHLASSKEIDDEDDSATIVKGSTVSTAGTIDFDYSYAFPSLYPDLDLFLVNQSERRVLANRLDAATAKALLVSGNYSESLSFVQRVTDPFLAAILLQLMDAILGTNGNSSSLLPGSLLRNRMVIEAARLQVLTGNAGSAVATLLQENKIDLAAAIAQNPLVEVTSVPVCLGLANALKASKRLIGAIAFFEKGLDAKGMSECLLSFLPLFQQLGGAKDEITLVKFVEDAAFGGLAADNLQSEINAKGIRPSKDLLSPTDLNDFSFFITQQSVENEKKRTDSILNSYVLATLVARTSLLTRQLANIAAARVLSDLYLRAGSPALALEFFFICDLRSEAFSVAKQFRLVSLYVGLLRKYSNGTSTGAGKLSKTDAAELSAYLSANGEFIDAAKLSIEGCDYSRAVSLIEEAIVSVTGKSQVIEEDLRSVMFSSIDLIKLIYNAVFDDYNSSQLLGDAKKGKNPQDIFDGLVHPLEHLISNAGPKFGFHYFISINNIKKAVDYACKHADELQLTGNYKSALQVLLSLLKQIKTSSNIDSLSSSGGESIVGNVSGKAAAIQLLNTRITLLHSYNLIKRHVKNDDHESAARLCIRICGSLSQFPAHTVALLTSAVIECQRAGLKKSAFTYAKQLMAPDMLPKVDPKFLKKIEVILRRPSDEEKQEAESGCVFCGEALGLFALTCESCSCRMPTCLFTGMRVAKDDVSYCPNCLCVCSFSAISNVATSAEPVCPLCSEQIDIKNVRSPVNPLEFLKLSVGENV